MSPASSGQPPTLNPNNQRLRDQRDTLRQAWRHPLGPGCGPYDPDNIITPPPAPPTDPTTRRRSLRTQPIVVTTAGDNILIPAASGPLLIYEMFVWNVIGQNLTFTQGPSGSGILWFQLLTFPALTGFSLPFNGNFEQPHYEIDNNQPLVLNISAAGNVGGFIRYRIPNGAF